MEIGTTPGDSVTRRSNRGEGRGGAMVIWLIRPNWIRICPPSLVLEVNVKGLECRHNGDGASPPSFALPTSNDHTPRPLPSSSILCWTNHRRRSPSRRYLLRCPRVINAPSFSQEETNERREHSENPGNWNPRQLLFLLITRPTQHSAVLVQTTCQRRTRATFFPCTGNAIPFRTSCANSPYFNSVRNWLINRRKEGSRGEDLTDESAFLIVYTDVAPVHKSLSIQWKRVNLIIR